MHSSKYVTPFLKTFQSCHRRIIPALQGSTLIRTLTIIHPVDNTKPRKGTTSLTLNGLQSYAKFKKRNTLSNIRFKSDSAPKVPKDILLTANKNGVTTLTMNQPKKLNGWTGPMMIALRDALLNAARDGNTKVAILTGADPYYCAGVNLSDTIKPMHPATLHKMIVESNAAIFNSFIDFPKPLIIAANGPAIGACFTSATLADCIIASEKATFSTPFHRLGVTPEGCSSVHFERIMGKKNAERMLGAEGWTPTAAEAKVAGFVAEVVPHDKLLSRSQELAEKVNTQHYKKY